MYPLYLLPQTPNVLQIYGITKLLNHRKVKAENMID